ncbi:lysozyme-like isoform X2 [Daphnia pulex]|uniref:lysozyme-like isoform X2 n=1 Tax=Daphnia pulex TaxID=6669 RepID=UPI001EDD344A|nr:lysozyme-like isoform X2 [Daphnia pulex]
MCRRRIGLRCWLYTLQTLFPSSRFRSVGKTSHESNKKKNKSSNSAQPITGMFSSATSPLFTTSVLMVFMASWCVPAGRAQTYDRCQLARDLLHKYKLPANQISQWICLVRWESNFNTSAIGSLNSDGSLDHGLFQISDLFWCDHQQGMDSACGLTCESLRNEDIKDDVICAKRIFRQHQHLTGNGFNACFAFLAVRRVAWRLHCQGDTDSYTADCNTSSSSPSAANDSSGADRERKPQLAAQPENPQQSNSNWLWSPFSQAFPTGWLFF